MQMKAKYVDPVRIINNLDTAIRDAEIRAYFDGLSHSEMSYENKMLAVVNKFIVSFETAKKVISAKKQS